MSGMKVLQISGLLLLAILGGCAGMGKPPLRYIADSNEINDAPTPSGFLISPQEANHTAASRQFVGKKVRHFYHDGENYYSVYNRSIAAHARKHGTIINGRTGQIYDRESKSWEADPRKTNSTSADDAATSPSRLMMTRLDRPDTPAPQRAPKPSN